MLTKPKSSALLHLIEWTKLPKDCSSKTSQEDDATMLEVWGYSYDQINLETLT